MEVVRHIVHLRNERLWRVLQFGLLLLIVAHGALTTLIPFLAFNILVVVLIAALIFFRFKKSRDYFELVLLLYVLAHFTALGSKGGLAPLISFVTLLLLFVSKLPILESEGIVKSGIFKLSIALLLMNILGWLFKPTMTVIETILGAASYIGCLFAFWLASSLKLTLNKLSLLVKLIVLMIFYQSLIALNTYLGLIKTSFVIFFPATSRFGSKFTEGSFNHSELFGEFNLLCFVLLFAFILARKSYFNIPSMWLYSGVLFSVINIFLSGSRSVFGLFVLACILIIVVGRFIGSTAVSYKKVVGVSLFGLVFISMFWIPLNLGYVLTRFDKEDSGADQFKTDEISLSSIVTGEGTPREGAFIYFFDRYQNESNVLVGHGYGTLTYNRKAWFGNLETTRADYHSLYLSIIITYGWIGAVLYILIPLLTVGRLLKMMRVVLRANEYERQYFYPLLGFFLMIIFLMINEYKISLLRVPAYHMLTWVWFGLANALINSVKSELNENSLAGSLSLR